MATSVFECSACGHSLTARHMPWFCENCGRPETYSKSGVLGVTRAKHASEIGSDEPERTPTGDSHLDAMLQGGLVFSSTALAFGLPGTGKSRSLLRWACHIGKTLLVSLEMPEKLAVYSAKSARANIDNLYVTEDEDTWREEAFRLKPVAVVFDSFHYSQKQRVVPGSKVPRVCYELSEWAKQAQGVGLMVSHQNKRGQASGSNNLQHWPDYVFKFEKHGNSEAKVGWTKSRYCPTGSAIITI